MRVDENIPPANEQGYKCSCGHFGSQHFHQPGQGKGGGHWTKCIVDGCPCMEFDQFDAPFSPETLRIMEGGIALGLLAGSLRGVENKLADLCQQIESMGASDSLTKASLTASQARQELDVIIKNLQSTTDRAASAMISGQPPHTDDVGAH